MLRRAHWKGGLGVVLVGGAVVVAAAGGLARAAEPRAPMLGVVEPLPHAPARQGDKPRIAVHAYDVDGAPNMAAELDDAAEATLKADGRVQLVPFWDLLNDPPTKIAQALGRADLAVVDAEDAFGAMDLPKAKDLLQSAIDSYVRYLPQLAARGNGTDPLRDAWIKMAKVRFFDGDADGAKEALRYVFALDPKLPYSSKTFPPQMKKMVVEAQLLVEALGSGPLLVDSEPPGATVYLNGTKLAKPTPADPHDMPPGPIYVSYERRNYAPQTIVFDHQGPDPANVTHTLLRYPNNPIAPINRARAPLDKGEKPATLKEAAEALGVEMLVLLRAQRVDAPGEPVGKLRVVGWIYDVRVDRVLKRSERVVEETSKDAAATGARFVARDLLVKVRLDGVDAPYPEPKVSRWEQFSTKARDDFQRFYKWKGFWWVVGGASAAIVITVVGAAAGSADHRHAIARDVVLLGGN
jgi:hypothetical protein